MLIVSDGGANHGRADMPEEDAPIFARQTNLGLPIDLAAAIESLTHKSRNAIIFRDCEKCSIKEIGVSLKLTCEAVKSRIHRGTTDEPRVFLGLRGWPSLPPHSIEIEKPQFFLDTPCLYTHETIAKLRRQTS